METSASFEARFAPLPYGDHHQRRHEGGCQADHRWRGPVDIHRLVTGQLYYDHRGEQLQALVRSNVVLRVGRATSLDFTLVVGTVATTVEVKGAAPLLNTGSAALGQEVDNRYVTEVPLLDRSMYDPAFLALGFTAVSPSGEGATIGTTGGTNSVSNGQRNATAQFRLDGRLLTIPESGESQNTITRYQTPTEVMQEFKIQNNSFLAEYGNNGGTIVNVVSISGTNQFHGVGYSFGRRPTLDAQSFYANKAGLQKSPYARDRFGPRQAGYRKLSSRGDTKFISTGTGMANSILADTGA
jgi:hypothetical protein